MTCPVMVNTFVPSKVEDLTSAQQLLTTNTLTAFTQTVVDFTTQLQDLDIPILDYELVWPDIPIGDPWIFPTPPGPFSYTFPLIDEVPSIDVSLGEPPSVLSYPAAPPKPSIDTSGLPTPWTGTIPTEIPAAPEIVLPRLEELPTIPTLENIPLPELDPIVYPTFDGIRPDTAVALPDFPVPPEELPYSSEILSATQSQILSVLSGSRGYLDAIWDMIWERAFWNEANAAQAANEATMELWASKGWPVPGGVEAEQLLAQEQKILSESLKRAREIAIEQNKAEVERFNFHVAQGIALEGQLINLHSQSMERVLKATELTIRSSEALLQAKISIINMQLSAYKTDAEVYVQRLQGEMAKVQVYAEQLKAAGLLLDVEKGKIQIVISTIDAMLRSYLGQIDGVKAQLDIARLNVQIAVERINAARAGLEAKKLEYDGYDSKIRGQMGIANIWQTEGQVFLAHTQAISNQNDAHLKQFGAQIEKRKLMLEKLQIDLKEYEVKYNAEVAKMDASVKEYGARVSLYDSEVKGEIGRVSSVNERFKALVDEVKAEESLKIQEAQIGLQQAMRIMELELSGLEKLMTAHASIGSAALASLNINAGISQQEQLQSQWSYDYQCN